MTANKHTPSASSEIDGLPPAGARRFWYATHQPSNAKMPLLLELREQTNSGDEIKLSFSRLIGKQATIADPAQIAETATDILIRAGKVDLFVGILKGSA